MNRVRKQPRNPRRVLPAAVEPEKSKPAKKTAKKTAKKAAGS